MLVRWKDGTESVMRLKELKENYPVEVAQYAYVGIVLTRYARCISGDGSTRYQIRKFAH